jgi:hypothetical protein
MPNNDFEKQLQKKMGELNFTPSDAVWQDVEQQINHRKKRRRFLLWIPFLFLVTGGAAWLYYTNTGDNLNNSTAQIKNRKIPETGSHDTAVRVEQPTQRKNDVASATNKPSTETRPEDVHEKEAPVAGNTNQSIKHRMRSDQHIVQRNQTADDKHSSVTKHKKSTNDKTKDILIIDADAEKAPIVNKEQRNAAIAVDKNVPDNNSGDKAPDRLNDSSAVAITQPTDKTKEPVIEDKKRDSIMAVPAKKSIAAGRKKIEWGVTANIGFSNVSKNISGFLSPSRDVYNSYASYTAPGNINNNNGAGVNNPSAVKTGPAFSLGITARKALGKAWSVFAAVDYSYYSTKISVGQKIDSVSSVNQAGLSMQKDVSSYYKADNTDAYNYTNQFHFIEIPVGVEKQFGSRSLFSAIGGFTLAAFLSSNMLHYDAQKNIYYKDNSLINKTKLDFFAGFNYRLWQKKATSLEIGPRFQYSLTNFLQRELYGSNHLFSAAIAARLMFHRK